MKKIILAISITLLLLSPVVAYSQEPLPPLAQVKIEKKTDDAKPEISGKADAKPPQNRMPIVVNKVHTTSNETHRQHTETKENKKRGETLFSSLLVFFTGCLVICNILLWRVTKKSADAAKQAADAAKKSIDTLPTIERAYIYVSCVSADFESWRHTKPNQRSPIIITVRNYGRTPAKLTGIATKFKIGKSDGIKISWEPPEDDEIIDSVGRFIASNFENGFSYYVHDTIGDGRYHIIFSGEVRYKDIFEKDHIAYFKWSLVSHFERGFYINDPDENYTT